MAHVVKISNPLSSKVISLKREFAVDYQVLHTKISELDACQLSLAPKLNQIFTNTNKGIYIPLKIHVNQNTAFISALVTGDKTVFGSMAIDELSNQI